MFMAAFFLFFTVDGIYEADSDDEDPFNNYFQFDDEDFDVSIFIDILYKTRICLFAPSEDNTCLLIIVWIMAFFFSKYMLQISVCVLIYNCLTIKIGFVYNEYEIDSCPLKQPEKHASCTHMSSM